eukprot:5113146-Pleurochrysis_carterae.AAC.2
MDLCISPQAATSSSHLADFSRLHNSAAMRSTPGRFEQASSSAAKRPFNETDASTAAMAVKHPRFQAEYSEESISAGMQRPIAPGMQRLAAPPACPQQPVLSFGAGAFRVPVHSTFSASNSEHGMSNFMAAQPQMIFAPQMFQGAQFAPGAFHPGGPQYSHYQPQIYHHDFYANAPTPALNRCEMQTSGCSSSSHNTVVAIDNPTWSAGHYSSSSGLMRNPHAMLVQQRDGMSSHHMAPSLPEHQANGPAQATPCLRQPPWDSSFAYRP